MLIHRCGPTCFLMPTGAPGRGLTAAMTCQPSVASDAITEAFAGLDGNTDDDGVGRPRALAQMGCKLELLTVSSISSATLDAGWRGRIGLGTGLGNAPARPLPAVAEGGDVDALGAVGRGDAAQLIRQTFG